MYPRERPRCNHVAPTMGTPQGTPEIHLGQMLFRSKAKAVDCVSTTVCPLSKLLGGFGKGHVGGDSAIDNGLGRKQQRLRSVGLLTMNMRPLRYPLYECLQGP